MILGGNPIPEAYSRLKTHMSEKKLEFNKAEAEYQAAPEGPEKEAALARAKKAAEEYDAMAAQRQQVQQLRGRRGPGMRTPSARLTKSYGRTWREMGGATQDALKQDADEFAKQTEKSRADRDKAIAAAQAGWLGDVNNGNADGKKRVADQQAAVDAARAELAAAQEAANKAKDEADKKKPAPGLDAFQQAAVSGTFSGAVAGMLGGGADLAGKLDSQIDILGRIEDNTRRGSRVAGVI